MEGGVNAVLAWFLGGILLVLALGIACTVARGKQVPPELLVIFGGVLGSLYGAAIGKRQ